MATKNTDSKSYRLIAGVYAQKDEQRHVKGDIVVSSKPLAVTFAGQFIELSDTAPLQPLLKNETAVTGKSYNQSRKFKSALDKGLTVYKKDGLYFVAPIKDPHTTAINKVGMKTPADVVAYVENTFK